MPFLGELSALLTAFLWSGTSIVFTEATKRVGSIQVNITRMLLALLMLGLTIWIFGLDLTMSTSQIVNLTWSGVVGLVIGDSFLFRAFKDIGARVSMLIMSLVPAMTAVMGLMFLDEHLSTEAVLGMVITIGCITFVVLERRRLATDKHAISPRGLIYAIIGALGQAAGLIFAKLAFNEAPIHGMVATTVRIASAVILFVPIAVLLRWYPNPFKVYRNNRAALGFTMTGAVLGPYLGITFSLVAIAHTEVAVATTIMSLPPIIMLPMVYYYYKETLSWRAVAGAVIAVLGVSVLFLR